MFPNNVQFLGRERDRERYQEAEHIRLVKIARGEQVSYRVVARKIAHILGVQMVKWGAKLQNYDTAPLPQIVSMDTTNV